ncbi:MAG: two-component regulator propeller domain-containing protein, partial [Chitinivibrionales bacterium]
MGIEFMRITYLFFLPLLLWTSISAYSPFRNFNSTVAVNDVAIINQTVWVASKGGLARVQKGSREISLPTTNVPFGDVKLTALAPDKKGGMWIGTANGTLYYYRNGILESFNSYRSASWDIRDLSLHGDILLVSSSVGVSLFDVQKKAAVANATAFQGIGPITNCARIHGDTLYVGLSNGYAKTAVDTASVREKNFFDETIWSVEERDEGVKQLLVHQGRVKDYAHITVLDGSTEYYADSATIYKNGNKILSLPSTITALTLDSDGTLWCGTSDDYFYSISGSKAQQYRIPGMYFSNVSRVAVGAKGRTWFIPRIAVPNTPWWQGVVSYDGSHWELYNKHTVGDFRELGDGTEFMGISRGHQGDMWFGANGEGLRKYNTETDQWSRYFVGVLHLDSFKVFKPGEHFWNKSDAVASDSSGYLWAAAYDCYEGKLVCYDSRAAVPTDDDYIRISEASDQKFVSINVDQAGRVFAGSTDGQLLIITHDGSPLDGVTPYVT